MFIHYYLRKKTYKLSNRNYLCDYSKLESKKIDMTLSGRYLSLYPKVEINASEFDKYPLATNIKALEDLIKSKISTKSEIVIGSGANGLLQNIIKILFRKKGNLVTPFYTFDQAEFAVTSFGSVTKRVYTNQYNIDLDNIIKSIDKKTRMIYICNPNNPTGKFINPKDLINLSKKVNVPVVIDESGIEFTKKKGILEIAKRLPNNLLVLRSFSKAYGLANLRIGYLACCEEFQKTYLENITTNECSGISCLIAKTILEKSDKYMKKNLETILEEKERISLQLEKLGIKVLKGYSNTIFTETYFDSNFLEKLHKNDISVVPVYDRNNHLHFRIAVQDKKTNNQFLKKMKRILKDEMKSLVIYKD